MFLLDISPRTAKQAFLVQRQFYTLAWDFTQKCFANMLACHERGQTIAQSNCMSDSRSLSRYCACTGTAIDFKRLFTVSEYCDRDRMAFYRAIQGLREQDMDMTGWIEYFVEGLSIQLAEVKRHGERAIRQDVLVREHNLSERQTLALGHDLEHGGVTIQDYENLYPDVSRRTLQQDLKEMIDKGLFEPEGATHRLICRQRN